MLFKGFDVPVTIDSVADEVLFAITASLETTLSIALVGLAVTSAESDSAEAVGTVGRSGTALSEAEIVDVGASGSGTRAADARN